VVIYGNILIGDFMVYLDYSATTQPADEVLESFVEASKRFIGNPNSLHKLGVEASDMINKASEQIGELIGAKTNEIIYTSSASESNNLAIKGVALKYKNRGNHIIITSMEHPSVYETVKFLGANGFKVSVVSLDEYGRVDLNSLKKLITDKTILVSVCAVSSEVGIIQPIEEIGVLLKKHPKCFFHVDATQAIGKINIDYENVDLISFSPHKFYGMKGIGVLVKRTKIELEPTIHGGKSTTKYRSGTPALPLIVSTAKALRLALTNVDKKYKMIEMNNIYLKSKLSKYADVLINSNNNSIPHILNISVANIKPETLLHALEEQYIFISTQTACSGSKESKEVMAMYNDKPRALSTLRISVSYLTTNEEVEKFLLAFDMVYKRLVNLK